MPSNPPLPYYVAILVDRKRAKRGTVETIPFPKSQMGRQLLAVRLEVTNAGPQVGPLLIATAHLESTKDHGVERKRQLLQALQYLKKSVPPNGVGILGGDLNIRDEEVRDVQKQMGEDALRFSDVWIFCGSPESDRWTWDTTVNQNIGATFSCKTRFDRIFFISPGVSDVKGAPTLTAKAKAKAVKYGDGWQPKSILAVVVLNKMLYIYI